MKICLIYFILLCSVYSFSQENNFSFSLLKTELIDADEFIGYDPFGYAYYLKGNVFNKQDKQELFQYKNVALGKIKRIDILNPLKIVLFYENFNTIILLDNQLNETQKINFSENQTPIVASGIGLAAQNKLWVFNNLNQQLGLFDLTKNSFSPLATPFSKTIKFYHSDYNYFHWVDSSNEAYYCDLFGRITSLGTIPNADAVYFISDYQFMYSIANQLYWVDFKKNINLPLTLNEKTFKSFTYKEQILTIFTEREIRTFKIQLP
jgi:hypothetical protein